MSRRRPIRSALLVCGAALVSLTTTAAPAGGEDVAVEVGWFTSNPAATAPERGFAVSAGPNGNISVAALRAPVGFATVDSATLTLVEEGGVQQSGAALQVCPTPNAWTGGAKQSLDRAPKPECDQAKVQLQRAEDGTWTADVREVLSSTSAGDREMPSLMVVPAGSGTVPLGFEVRFQPPRLAVTGSGGSDTAADGDGGGPTSFDVDPGSTSGPASSGGGEATTSSFDAGSFSVAPSPDRSPLASFAPSQLSGTVESTPTAEGAAAEQAVATPAAGAVPPASTRPASSTAPANGSRRVQALFFVAVATTVGVGVGFAHARFRPEVGGA